ncbi:MAG: Rrf2 family transcriptional regulator [Anaerolineae bacterium]|nr:Rrf2 family transcriptional regulator [Anaerolineae bacterium]
MRVSAREQYGLRVMAELAKQYGAGPISLSTVSEVQGISLDYLEQIVPALRDAGLVFSTRGARGGYELARSPDRITVGEVLRALEGEILPVRCLDESCTDLCERTDECRARTVWKTIHDQVSDTLDGMRLADL